MQNFSTNYVIVNIWTSAENAQLPGANVGHVSLQTHYAYMSLWPGKRAADERVSRSHLTKMQQLERTVNSYFESRPPQYMRTLFDDMLAEAGSERQMRDINFISQCQADETPVLFDFDNDTTQRLEQQPKFINENQALIAVKLIKPSVRLAFFTGIDSGKIHEEFKRRKEHITGWKLIGSNMLSFSTSTEENCASFARKLLEAGGFLSLLKNTEKVSFSSTFSSVTSPDDLAIWVIKAKINEQSTERLPHNLEPESDLTQLKIAYGFQTPDEQQATQTSGASRLMGMFNKTY